MEELPDNKILMLIHDIYLLRYLGDDTVWHLVTDYLADKMKEFKVDIEFGEDELRFTYNNTTFGVDSYKRKNGEQIAIHRYPPITTA